MDISSRPVILVSMPWAPPTEPSLGLAVLRSCLLRRGYCVEVFHASTHFLRWVSLETSLFAAECWGLNEFVFTKAIDEQADEVQLRALVSRAESYVGSGRHPRYQSVSAICDLFLTLREQIAPDFLRECTDYILAKEPILVGFTCMFDQTIASAAL